MDTERPIFYYDAYYSRTGLPTTVTTNLLYSPDADLSVLYEAIARDMTEQIMCAVQIATSWSMRVVNHRIKGHLKIRMMDGRQYCQTTVDLKDITEDVIQSLTEQLFGTDPIDLLSVVWVYRIKRYSYSI